MQTTLFDDLLTLNAPLQHNLDGALICEFGQIFEPEEASALLHQLISSINWQQDTLRIAGKVIKVPRLQCWMGDKESRYGYSGMRLEPEPWQAPVLRIRHRVQELAGQKFNSVLLNYYRNGQDSVAWHADDESELGPDPIIASVSLGAERPFDLKTKPGRHQSNAHSGRLTGNTNATSGRSRYRLNLRHGSLLIMGRGLQNNWVHQLPKVKDLERPRVNLTFRNIVIGATGRQQSA